MVMLSSRLPVITSLTRLAAPNRGMRSARESPSTGSNTPMSARRNSANHTWQFRTRFRKTAFGWKSQPAIQRVREAVSEIKQVARRDSLVAAEGAVLFLEKVSPALERVDSSSGAIGTAVNHAIATLVPIIAASGADGETHAQWLERLWDAYQDDDIPYIEQLGDHWGELCASKKMASEWADRLIGTCRLAWSNDPKLRDLFKGTTNCLSALLAAGRHDELLELLDTAPYDLWHYRKFGVQALAATGRKADAIRYAESGDAINVNPILIARTCEEILLSSGLAEEAYRRYALEANRATTYLAWFRAVAKKYPQRRPSEILHDLVAYTPGEEGKWFAAAKEARFFDEAIALANAGPCSPQTLTRAARDFAEKNPAFALEAGIAALRWLVEGYGYEITSLDVLNAHTYTMQAAEKLGRSDEIRQRIRDVVAQETSKDRFVTKVLGNIS